MRQSDDVEVNRFRRQLTPAGVGRLMGVLLGEEDDDVSHTESPRIKGYVLDQLLGRGAGGCVYMGFWGNSEEAVAVKVLAKPLGNQKRDQRAWRELDVLSHLNVAGVPRVLDYGIADGHMYITTRLVEGKTLQQHCELAKLSIQDRVRLLIALAELVQTVHEHGVIHRDLKPTNIIIQPNGTPVLLDFGIASLIESASPDALTVDGDPIGTVGYMSPEQARGDRHGISSRSDIYALGAIAFQMFTGQTPHDLNVALHEAIRRVAQVPGRNPLDLNPQLPKSLSCVIARALEIRPEDRYASAAALADDLRRWLRHEPIAWQKSPWLSRQWLALKRNPASFFAKAAVWLLVVATILACSLAYAGFKIAEGERVNSLEASTLRDKAQELAKERSEFAKRQAELAAHWEAEAREREAWRKEVEEGETKRIVLRERQVARMKKATDSGDLYGASIVLLNFAEEIKELRHDDKAILDAYIERLNALIESAGAADSPKPYTGPTRDTL
jgi:eukaryotic-like serine/threonine-protein kinase